MLRSGNCWNLGADPTISSWTQTASFGLPKSGQYRISRLDPVSREIREFAIPTPGSRPYSLAFDRRGLRWFTQESGNRIGLLDPSDGSFEEFRLPTLAAGLDGLELDSEGNLWFGERGAGKLGRLNPNRREIEEFDLPGSGVKLWQIALDLEGRIWFTRLGAHGFDPDCGTTSLYEVPSAVSGAQALAVDCSDRI